MKRIQIVAAMVAAGVVLAMAAAGTAFGQTTFGTVGTYDPDNVIVVEATGNSSSLADFQAAVSAAYAAGAGGVVNFDDVYLGESPAQLKIGQMNFDYDGTSKRIFADITSSYGKMSVNLRNDWFNVSSPNSLQQFNSYYTWRFDFGAITGADPGETGVTQVGFVMMKSGSTPDYGLQAKLSNGSTATQILVTGVTSPTFFQYTAPDGLTIDYVEMYNSVGPNGLLDRGAYDEFAFITSIIPEPPTTGDLTIKKFFDCDQDGNYDVADADKMLSGWSFEVRDPNGEVVPTDPTDAGGQIVLTDLTLGDYTITETVKKDHDVSLLPGDPNNTNPRIVTVAAGENEAWFGNWLVADVNQDGIVDSQDFSLLKTNFGKDPGLWTAGNINDDTLVDSQDFSLLKTNFGKGVAPGSPGGSPVPEPATMVLLAAGSAAVLIRRSRKASA